MFSAKEIKRLEERILRLEEKVYELQNENSIRANATGGGSSWMPYMGTCITPREAIYAFLRHFGLKFEAIQHDVKLVKEWWPKLNGEGV